MFVSSASVYDAGWMTSGGMVDEDSPLERTCLREALCPEQNRGGIACATLLRRSAGEADDCATRLVYGPRSRNVLNGAALSVRDRLLITTGTPKKKLPLIYVDDLVEILIRIASNDAAIGRVYNVAHPDMPTTEQFLKTYRELSGDRRTFIDIPLPKLLPLFSMLDRVLEALGRKRTMRIRRRGWRVTRGFPLRECNAN